MNKHSGLKQNVLSQLFNTQFAFLLETGCEVHFSGVDVAEDSFLS